MVNFNKRQKGANCGTEKVSEIEINGEDGAVRRQAEEETLSETCA